MEGKCVVTGKCVLIENLVRTMLSDKTALFLKPLHISFWRDKNSVHILEFEESYVNHLLLKSVKNKFLWEEVYIYKCCVEASVFIVLM